jgi:protein TonB
MNSSKIISLLVHAAMVGWAYRVSLEPPPPIQKDIKAEIVDPFFVPPPPPPPPPPPKNPPKTPPKVTKPRVRPRAAAEAPRSAEVVELPIPPAPPSPPDAPIGETYTMEAYARDAIPVYRPAPMYPERAARRNKEGYVILRFTIKKNGTVGDITVVEGKPPGMFDSAAVKAMQKWKYEPYIWNGVPVDVPGVMFKMKFELE